MDGIINQVANTNLNSVGELGYEEDKRNILGAIRAVQPGFRYDSIEKITGEDIEDFNAAKIEIDRAFQEAFQLYGKHGALDCGIKYANYNSIRETFQRLNGGADEGRSYTTTLRFMISSMLALPAADDIQRLDKSRGERTFSKMCLNLAAKLSLDRFNWVDGYWTKKQMNDFPEVPTSQG